MRIIILAHLAESPPPQRFSCYRGQRNFAKRNFAKFLFRIFELLSRNFAIFLESDLTNCTETNFVSFLQLILIEINSILHYFVNMLCCEGNFFRDSRFKERLSQDF
jgi:hypothetical protein